MRMVTFENGDGSCLRVAAAHLNDKPGQILFCFGIGDYPLTAYPVGLHHEPDSFSYFCEKWDSAGVGGNLADLWSGFLALRHLLGYATAWNDLPEHTRHALTLWEETWITDLDNRYAFPRRMESWIPNWQLQLQPLVDELRRNATP